ncbi:MAG: GNAT family N-acetyltransferase [Chloroflexota bacterium]|nr:GNAT family N-acetyltransferase [Chloroflexota bacterium]
MVLPLAMIRWKEWRDEPGREELDWWVQDLASEAGRDEPPVAFVAVDRSGEVVGGVTLARSDLTEEQRRGRTPWIAGMLIREDRRSSGFGTLLMARLEEWATAAGIREAWVVTGGRAVDFYRRCGWTAVEEVVVGTGDTATVLSKTLCERKPL